MANALTLLRLLLAVPFAWTMSRDGAAAGLAAGALLGVAIATDLLDGRVARRRGTSTPLGRLFDHAADFVFVTAGLAAGALRGAFPLLLPALVAVAFAQYVIDSYWLHRAPSLRMNALGRWNGILYFVPLCADAGVRMGALDLLHLGFLAPLVPWIAWTLAATTLLSIADRLLALRAGTPEPG